jgi:hypothetical protein
MTLSKNQKIMQIFSNGSLNFYFNSFLLQKNNQIKFSEKDIKNFSIYLKNKCDHLNIQEENIVYRKKYTGFKK